MQNFIKNKWVIIVLGILLAVLICCIVLFFTVSEYAHFKRTEDEALFIAGTISAGNNYFKLDTKSSHVPLDEMSNFQKNLHLRDESQAIEAIKFTNTELGFNESLYTYMATTTTTMGTQCEENENYIVTWTYSLDDGLEVKYQIKLVALLKIGG